MLSGRGGARWGQLGVVAVIGIERSPLLMLDFRKAQLDSLTDPDSRFAWFEKREGTNLQLFGKAGIRAQKSSNPSPRVVSNSHFGIDI